MGGFCPGGFCPGVFCPRGDFVLGGILSGGFCPGDFVLEPSKIVLYCHQYRLSPHQRTKIRRVFRRYSGGEKVHLHPSKTQNKRNTQVNLILFITQNHIPRHTKINLHLDQNLAQFPNKHEKKRCITLHY